MATTLETYDCPLWPESRNLLTPWGIPMTAAVVALGGADYTSPGAASRGRGAGAAGGAGADAARAPG